MMMKILVVTLLILYTFSLVTVAFFLIPAWLILIFPCSICFLHRSRFLSSMVFTSQVHNDNDVPTTCVSVLL